MNRTVQSSFHVFFSRFAVTQVSIWVALLTCLLARHAAATVVSGVGLSLETAKRIEQLNATAGYVERRQLVRKPYAEETVRVVVTALEEKPPISSLALLILLAMVRQYNMSAPLLNGFITPALNRLASGPLKVEDSSKSTITYLAQEALWHLRVHQTLPGGEREEFLRGYIQAENSSAYFYFNYATRMLDYFVAMGNERAREILREELQERQRKRVREQVLKRMQESIEKIETVNRLKNLDAIDKVALLQSLIESKKGGRYGENEILRVWLLWQLEDINHPRVVSILRTIWKDDTYSEDMQREAQAALLESGSIDPTERTLGLF